MNEIHFMIFPAGSEYGAVQGWLAKNWAKVG
jgi:hypothetical protein